MMLEFKKNGNGFSFMGDAHTLGHNRVCDGGEGTEISLCGKRATIVAIVAIKPLPGGDVDGRSRKEMSALFLCPDCAVEMIEIDIEIVRRKNHDYCCTRYMSMTEALQMAKECATQTLRPREKYQMSSKWKGVLQWMKAQNRFISIPEIEEKHKISRHSVGQMVERYLRNGFLERESRNGARVYRVPDSVTIC